MSVEQLIINILAPLAGYLLASIPFGLVIGKLNGVDIRTTGSKNIGATNLGRTLGPKFFWYAFILDAAKGFLPVLVIALLAQRGYVVTAELGPDMKPIPSPSLLGPNTLHATFGIMEVHHPFPSWIPLLTAIACVLGHNFPLYLRFKGGKGVATSFGVVLGFWPIYTVAGIGGGLVFVIILMIYRYISLASIIAVLAFAALVALLGLNPAWPTYQPIAEFWPSLAVAALFALLIIFRHRANISRLLKGTEPKIRSKAPA